MPETSIARGRAGGGLAPQEGLALRKTFIHRTEAKLALRTSFNFKRLKRLSEFIIQ
jgi:hypothetical protein